MCGRADHVLPVFEMLPGPLPVLTGSARTNAAKMAAYNVTVQACRDINESDDFILMPFAQFGDLDKWLRKASTYYPPGRPGGRQLWFHKELLWVFFDCRKYDEICLSRLYVLTRVII